MTIRELFAAYNYALNQQAIRCKNSYKQVGDKGQYTAIDDDDNPGILVNVKPFGDDTDIEFWRGIVETFLKQDHEPWKSFFAKYDEEEKAKLSPG